MIWTGWVEGRRTHLGPSCSALLVLRLAHGSCAEGRVVEGVTAGGEHGLLGADVCGGDIEVVVREFTYACDGAARGQCQCEMTVGWGERLTAGLLGGGWWTEVAELGLVLSGRLGGAGVCHGCWVSTLVGEDVSASASG